MGELDKREEGKMNENVWENWTKEGKVKWMRMCGRTGQKRER